MNTNLKPLMAAAVIAILLGAPALAASHSQRQVRFLHAPKWRRTA